MRKALYIIAPVLLLFTACKMQSNDMRQGTAFLIGRQFAVTNAHVVSGCDEVTLNGLTALPKVKVKVLDAERDLALLEFESLRPFAAHANIPEESTRQIASLRAGSQEVPDDYKVLLVGYPSETGIQGKYTMVATHIVAVEGVNVPDRFFIEDVVRHGEGGAPMLDTSGNVVGVVVAKSILNKMNIITHTVLAVQHVGVIIELAALKKFLSDHDVRYVEHESKTAVADNDIYGNAAHYIVGVQCLASVPDSTLARKIPARKTM